MILSFSGIDSSGKGTNIRKLQDVVSTVNCGKRKVIWSRFGYTPGIEFGKRVARALARNHLPAPGHSQQRDKLLAKSSLGAIWFTLAFIDFFLLHVLLVRIYHLRYKVILLDRCLLDSRVDLEMYHQERYSKTVRLFDFFEKLIPEVDANFYFSVSPQESLRRSIEKREEYSESLDVRVRRIEIYERILSGAEYIRLDTESNSEEQIFKVIAKQAKLADS